MSKKSEEHYQNHPKDIEHNAREKKITRRYQKLRSKFKVFVIRHHIKLRLLRQQLRADANIKDMFMDMYPNEYDIALKSTMDKYGLTPTRKQKREEIIQSMNLKDRNILK